MRSTRPAGRDARCRRQALPTGGRRPPARPPVELASPPCDKYFPPAESRALARAVPRIRVTVTPALAHADPRIALRDLRGLAELWGFGVRALRSLAS
jgi:hypothetical protein